MARKKANLKYKSTIKQHAYTLASVVLKPIRKGLPNLTIMAQVGHVVPQMLRHYSHIDAKR